MSFPDLITVRVHFGGKFEGETSYIGGELDILEEWDWYSWTFPDLVDGYVEPGCHDLMKFAFKVKSTDDLIFFKDENEYRTNIYNCVDMENKRLDIYVDCRSLVDNIDDALDPNDGFNDFDVDGGKHMNTEDDIEGLESLEPISGKGFEGLQVDVVNEMGSVYEGGDLSEYDKSDDSIYEDEDAKKIGNMVKNLQYDKDCDPKTLKLQLGMRFADVAECKEAVKLWAIVNGHNIKWVKSEADRIQAKCEPGCPWKLYASKLTREPTCVIKRYVGKHECVRPIHNRQVTSAWIADRFLEHLKTNPMLKALELQRELRKKYQVRAPLLKCYRAKKKAMDIIHGTLEGHYAKIRSYLMELQKRDREGTFLLKTYLNHEEKPVFQRVYLGFSALRKGFFIGCRRFISFDACFLKTTIGGALLAAISKDCNHKMYPLAWAVVEKENEETWMWFMEKLFEDLRIIDGFGWTFMSDKQKGLINAVHTLAPNAEHRHCARHIYANWKKKWPGVKFQILFWNIVKSTCMSDYNAQLAELRAESSDAAEDFLIQNPKSFCKSHINSYNKLDIVDNNICESFNSYILKFRDSPLIDMLDGIRLLLMRRLYDLHKLSEGRRDVLCPNIRIKLEHDLNEIKHCDVALAVGGKYEVQKYNDTHIVDLVEKECSCRYWELTGLPCCHALACIVHCREDYAKFVDVFYHSSNWQSCYKNGLQPIQGEKEWPLVNEPPVLPPQYQKQPGRPKKVRKRGHDEPKKVGDLCLSRKGKVKMSCSKCGGSDHNVRTCKATTSQKITQPKKARGRPRKDASISGSSSTLVDQPTRSRSRGRPRGSTSNQERPTTVSSGLGLLHTDTGNVYLMPSIGRRVHVMNELRSSQSSQVIDAQTPP